LNHYAAYPVPVPGGYWGMIRLAQDGQPWPIMDGDKPRVYPTELKARCAAQAHVIQRINGTMRRDGEVLQTANDADKLFNLPSTIKQRGKQRRIAVERKAVRG
jgi:hypothetical protein